MAEEYGHLLRGEIVRCGVDNVGVVFSTLKGTSRCTRTQSLLRRLADAQTRHGFDVIACHVTRALNGAADTLTRFARMQELAEALPQGVEVGGTDNWGRSTRNSPAGNEPVYYAKLRSPAGATSQLARADRTSARLSSCSSSATRSPSPASSATCRSTTCDPAILVLITRPLVAHQSCMRSIEHAAGCLVSDITFPDSTSNYIVFRVGEEVATRKIKRRPARLTILPRENHCMSGGTVLRLDWLRKKVITFVSIAI